MRAISISALVVAFCLIGMQGARAQGHWYLGVSLGSGEANRLSFEDIDDGSALSGSFDDADFGWKLVGGYAYNEFFSIEGSFVDLGEVSLDAESDGDGSIFDPGPVTTTVEADGFALAAVGRMPVTDRLEIFAKAGFFAWDSTTTLSNSAIGSISGGDDGSDPMFGLGAEYEFNGRFVIRGEIEQFSDIRDRDGTLLSAGILIRF